METENNVVTINGQEYIEDNLNDNQKYFINQIRDLQLKAANLRFQLDQVVVAQDKFTEELIKTVEVVEEQEEFPQIKRKIQGQRTGYVQRKRQITREKSKLQRKRKVQREILRTHDRLRRPAHAGPRP